MNIKVDENKEAVEAEVLPGVVEETPVVEGETGTEAKSEEKEEDVKPAKVEDKPKDWRDKRIAKLTAKLSEKEREVTSLKEGKTVTEGLTPEEIDRRIEEAAARKLQLQEFNRETVAAANEGKKIYGEVEFKTSVDALAVFIDKDDLESVTRYNQFIQTALDTGKAHQVVYELGRDLDEAERILALPPTKQAIALERLVNKAPDVTKLGKPITPIGSRSAAHTAVDPTDKERGDRLSTAEWMKRREEQVKATRTRR